ncbi:MAG TPA: AAA family ATPase [Kofleriaceae bacterium]|nr:AAA family ATPase [Kofleriaceae bacterium]
MTRVSQRFVRSIYVVEDKIPDASRYPFSIPAVRTMGQLDLDAAVTIFVGDNGSGKSTLIEAIAVAAGFNAEGGSRNFNFKTRGSESELHACLRLVRGVRRPRDGFFLRAESFFNVATEVENVGAGGSYGGRSLHEQSHGEAFMALAENRFGDNSLYILDEPEAALSPQRQLSFLAIIHQLATNGSQLVMATHSPILMAYPDAAIYRLDGDGIARVDYEDTEHFQITRSFLTNREIYLRKLLDDK